MLQHELPTLSLIHAGQLLTIDSKQKDSEGLGIIEDGAFIVKRGKFEWVGSTKELEKKTVKTDIQIDAKGFVVTPGFIDPHTHLIFAGSREDELERKIKGESYIQILKSGGGINRTIHLTRKASEEELIKLAISRINQLIRSGVTTIEIKTGYCQDLAGELKMLRVASRLQHAALIDVVKTFLGLHAVPPEFRNQKEYSEYVIKEMLPSVANSDNPPAFSDCFCEEDIFDRKICERYLKASSKFGLRLKIHADEFSYSQGAELAAEAGCVSADHLENSSLEGLKKMASRGVVAVLLPGTAFYSRIEMPDYRKIAGSGCQVALGTDLSPNSWIESPQLVMAIACLQLGMTVAKAIRAFTVEAAKALMLADRGTISAGMKADFVIHRFEDYRFFPYRIGGSYVDSVFKEGRMIYSSKEED